MEIYNINKRKRTNAIRKYVKSKIGAATGTVKICNTIKMIMIVLAIALGIGNIIFTFVDGDPVDLLFLVITFGIPYALSFIPAMICKAAIGIDYMFRRKETITLKNDGFVYSYCDTRTGFHNKVFTNVVDYNAIDRIEYDEDAKIMEIYGNITVETYENNTLIESDTYGMIDFLNCFDKDIYRLTKDKARKG